jgi:cephalosporin hydroxylase
MTEHLIPTVYKQEIESRLKRYASDSSLNDLVADVLDLMNKNRYAYNFTWLGRPIIQIPQDTVTFQEIIWEVKPDLVIETGIAHGGSLIFTASMLSILEQCSYVSSPVVVGIDVDIRPHNRTAIEQHPLSKYIRMLQGSSVDPDIINTVKTIAGNHKRILLFLDSNHTHDHVLAELRAYANLVTPGSYCIVLDTGIEDIDPSAIALDRPWGKGNSPKSALTEFLNEDQAFELDTYYHEKSLITSAPGGIIRKI